MHVNGNIHIALLSGLYFRCPRRSLLNATIWCVAWCTLVGRWTVVGRCKHSLSLFCPIVRLPLLSTSTSNRLSLPAAPRLPPFCHKLSSRSFKGENQNPEEPIPTSTFKVAGATIEASTISKYYISFALDNHADFSGSSCTH